MPVNGKAHWEQDSTSIRVYDGTSNDYRAPSGPGIILEIGNAVNGDLIPTQLAQIFVRGHLVGSHIEGLQGGPEGAGARMWIDLTAGDPELAPAGATPGTSPYWAVTDPNGIIRVEAGFLATLGISPSQWGLRVNDGNGVPIFDSLGLIAVMQSLGIADVGSNSFNSVTFATVSSTQVNFQVTRAVNILVLFLTTGKVTAGTNNGLVRCNLIKGSDGSSVGVSGNSYFGPTNYVTHMGWRYYSAVPAGNYTAQVEAAVDVGGTTLGTLESAIQVIQMGV